METIFVAVLAYIVAGEAHLEHAAQNSLEDCNALNARAVAALKQMDNVEVYGFGCVKIDLIKKEATISPKATPDALKIKPKAVTTI